MKVAPLKVDNFAGSYYCETKDMDIIVGNIYIFKTKFGLESGKVLRKPFEIKQRKIKDIGEFVRLANQDDFKKIEKLEKKNITALKEAREKLSKHNLPMKIFEARYMFDETRIIFYFTAENRIDFRNYVRDLAAIFKKRIEMRQVSDRDEARMLGGIGICGKEFCCSQFLREFNNASIKMVREQNLSLNSSKISGPCGKVLCCLAYEYETYAKLVKEFPKTDTTVKFNSSSVDREKYTGYDLPYSSDMTGTVKGINVLKEMVYVELENENIIEVPLKSIKKSGVFNVLK